MDQPSPTTPADAPPSATAPPTQEEETRVEEFERLYRKLDARDQKMIAVYIHLLGHDREFQKMPPEEQQALLYRWFEKPPPSEVAS